MRRNFSQKTIKEARTRANGHCEGDGCGQPFGPHNPPEVHHIVEDWEGGEPVLENAQVLGRKCCHVAITAKATKRRAKADRQQARHLDTKVRKGPPLPGTRASGIRKRMNGEVERW